MEHFNHRKLTRGKFPPIMNSSERGFSTAQLEFNVGLVPD